MHAPRDGVVVGRAAAPMRDDNGDVDEDGLEGEEEDDAEEDKL